MADRIRIALTKGRLEKNTVDMLKSIGYDVTELENKGRKLILQIGNRDIDIVLAKANDVITYVEHGVCDMGIVGKDTILEMSPKVYEVLDLGFGRCKFALAAPKGKNFYEGYNIKVIASKYPNISRRFFETKNMDVDIVKIEGSVELAPLLGLSDAIVDIVETGNTLRANGLEVIEDVVPVSARVIVNRVSMKMRKEKIETIINDMKEYIK